MYRRILSKIKKSNFQAFLIQKQNNINWICNKDNYYLPAIALVTEKEVYIFTKSRNLDEFKKIYNEHKVIYGGINEVVSLCKTLKISSIAIEANYISYNEFVSISNIFSDFELIPETDFIEDLRMIKTEKEIELIKQAVSLADSAFLEFLNHLKIGLSEIEAKNIFRNILFSKGAQDLSFDILLSSGKRTFLSHSASSNKIIEYGDLVLMDFGIVLNGYCSDTTRTVVMGESNETQEKLYNLVLKAQLNAINSIKQGVTLKEADNFSREIIEKELQEGCYDYGLGHGLGMLVHEKPRMHPNNTELMKCNTVVSVEPGIYIPGFGGVRIEDDILIKKDGIDILTKSEKELIEI